MTRGRVVRPIETSIFLVIAFETSERAARVYEMFRDTVRDEMHRICDSDPKLTKAPARQVFFEMMQRWLGVDRAQAGEELLKVAKVAAFLELTAIGNDIIGETSRRIFEAAGKSAWSFYLAEKDKLTEG